jgi:hypothetical protein
VIDLEERLAELVQDPFEVTEMRFLVDDNCGVWVASESMR